MINSNEETKKVDTTKVDTSSNQTETTLINSDAHMSPLNDNLELKRLDEQLTYELMSIPSASYHEYRLQMFIILYAKKMGINYDMDEFGNIFLTKGDVSDGEFYPCVTAHMDTVQDKQIHYAKSGAKLTIKTRINATSKKHEIYVDDFGLGGDDKAGVVICLNMFNYVDTLKACFFVQEEVGCLGSKKIDIKKDFYKDWFSNVGYVIGFDSPELNRAAYSCSGTKLMNKDFFESNGLDVICKEHGLNVFKAEPYTDVKTIRETTDIICMNFGTGYWNCHMPNEYCVLEEMDSVLDMGIDIINKLGKTEHKLSHNVPYNYQDNQYFEMLNPNYKPTSYGGNYYGGRSYSGYDDDDYYDGYHYGSGGYNSNGSGSTQTAQSTTKNEVTPEMVEYIAKIYDDHILDIKENIAALCKANDIDFSLFENVFAKKITF